MYPEQKLQSPAPASAQQRIGVPAPAAPPPKKPPKRQSWRSSLSTVSLFILAPVFALLISNFALQSYQVDGASMEQTLSHKDRLILNKVSRTWAKITGHDYIPKRGDIVIFDYTLLPGARPKQLIKRVVGLPGDKVVVSHGQITIYNGEHSEGFNPDEAGIYQIDSKTTPGNVDLTLAKDQVFVVGDNRTNSEDSRYFGPLKANQIIGKLSLRILPLNKIDKF